MAVTLKQWSDALEQVPIKEQPLWIYLSLKNKSMLHIFARYFFKHFVKTEVPDAHLDLYAELTARKDSAIIFPRGFGKTTLEKIDTIHDIVYALEPVILYIGSTLAEAQFHFESIKIELENNELLQYIYGDLVPPASNLSRKWTNKHLETVNGVNLVARGAGKGRGVNIKNKRPSKIILDDAENDEEVSSAERREKFHNWLYRVIMPSKDKERGFVKMIGTVISPHCELLKFYKAHGGIYRKAIENGESIWPSFWKIQDLYDIRDGFVDVDGNFIQGLGSRVFSQEFLNMPINEETARIKPSWISYYDDFKEGPLMRKVIMFDPQAGESKKADMYGLAVMGYYGKDPRRYLLEIKEGKASQIDQAALVVRAYQKHRQGCYVVGVEKVMAQVAVYQLILDWKAGKIELPNVDNINRNIPLIAVSPEGKDKVARLEVHEPEFERKHIYFHSSMRNFADKLIAFPEVEQDGDIDALIYCLTYSYKNMATVEGKTATKDMGTVTGNLLNMRF